MGAVDEQQERSTMNQRLRRFGAWVGSAAILVSTLFTPFAPLAAAQSDPAETYTTHAIGDVVINEIVPNASTEYVEIYNASAAPVNISNWRVRDLAGNLFGSIVPNDTQLNPGEFYTFTDSGTLNQVESTGQSTETVKLLDADNTTIIDSISYGQAKYDTAITPAANRSLGRVTNGTNTWYSGLTPTQGLTNGTPTDLPSKPLTAAVRGETNNAAHTINAASQYSVAVDVGLGANSLGTDTVTAQLIDRAGTLKSKTVAGTAGAGTVAPATFDTTQATAFVDSLAEAADVTVRAYVTNATSGISTAYQIGTPATRDTVAPDAPEAVTISAGSNNTADYISAGTVSNVTTQVDLPSSSTTSDTVWVELYDGVTTVKTSATALAGGVLQTITGLNANSIAQGTISLKATLTDHVGNPSSTLVDPTIIKDTVAPTGTLTINTGATVTTSSTVNLTIGATDTVSSVTHMRLANTSDFVDSSWETYATSKVWSLTTGEGPRTVYLQFKDSAGNISDIVSATILVETNTENITLYALATGENTIKQLPIEVTLTATTSASNMLTIAKFTANPGTNLPNGTTGIGRYYEVGLSDPTKVTFPVYIKLYYTTADLAAAGVTNENQLKGLAYFDQATQTWKYFTSTGVNTNDVTVPNPDNEGTPIQYAGFFYAMADHLTPLTGLADTTAPETPVLTTNAGDQLVDLSWTPVTDAANYVIRYRATGDTNGSYFQVIVAGSTTTARVTNLANGVRYEFGVAARDTVGNQSGFSTQFATPNAPVTAVLAAAPTTTTPLTIAISGVTKGGAGTDDNTDTNPDTKPPTDNEPGAGTTTSTDNDRDLSRLLITLAILIIAIGAGTAGYYGYQWWALRGATTATPPSTPIPPVTPPAPTTPVPPVTPSTPVAPPTPVTPPAPTPAPTPPTQPQSTPTEPPTPPQPPTGRW